MAKQLGSFELIARGTEAGATEVFIQYKVEESTDTEVNKVKTIEVADPAADLDAKTINGTGGWFETQVAAIKASEGIA
jgi:hypothetical protein